MSYLSPRNFYSAWGRLTADPVYKPANENNPHSMLRFRIAVNDTGAEPLFWDCVAWDDLTDSLRENLKKSKPVSIIGSIKRSRWTTAEGEEKECLTIVANNVSFFPHDQFNDK